MCLQNHADSLTAFLGTGNSCAALEMSTSLVSRQDSPKTSYPRIKMNVSMSFRLRVIVILANVINIMNWETLTGKPSAGTSISSCEVEQPMGERRKHKILTRFCLFSSVSH